MAESNDDLQKFDDLNQLLNNALNELNDPSSIKDNVAATATDEQKPFDKADDLNQLTDTFKKLMESSNDNAFDETMFETIRKLEESMKNIPAGDEDGEGPNEEEMAKIWAQMTSQPDNDDIFPPFFLDIMQKLLAKDVLYPPLKDLSTKFPEWLGENEDKLEPDELARYRKQHELVDHVCGYYEEGETNGGPIENKRFQKILTAMQEMQQCGQPPEALVAQNQSGGAGAPFQPSSMEDYNKLMEESGGMDQCKTM